MNLVVVESPAKAKTINKYLGDDYIVLASYGHIRDLPSKNGSVDTDNNFKMEWEVDSFSKKYLKEITDAAKISSKIILATDPDREGEAISWHLYEILKEKGLLENKPVHRVVFHEITKKAIREVVAKPRELSIDMVDDPANGTTEKVTQNGIDGILYTPDPGFTGVDVFFYGVPDGRGNNGSGFVEVTVQ